MMQGLFSSSVSGEGRRQNAGVDTTTTTTQRVCRAVEVEERGWTAAGLAAPARAGLAPVRVTTALSKRTYAGNPGLLEQCLLV
jgi:hypothetical protein